MADMTQATAQAHLDSWLAADTAVALGQSYSIGDVSLSRVDADRIKGQVAYWLRVVDSFKARAQNAATDGSFKVATF